MALSIMNFHILAYVFDSCPWNVVVEDVCMVKWSITLDLLLLRRRNCNCSLWHLNSSQTWEIKPFSSSAIIIMPLSGNCINISLIPWPSCLFVCLFVCFLFVCFSPLFCFHEHKQKIKSRWRLWEVWGVRLPQHSLSIVNWFLVQLCLLGEDPKGNGRKSTVSFTPLCLKHGVGKRLFRVGFVWHLTSWCLWVRYEPHP